MRPIERVFPGSVRVLTVEDNYNYFHKPSQVVNVTGRLHHKVLVVLN